jgi:A/G-specific adenine glycosylase
MNLTKPQISSFQSKLKDFHSQNPINKPWLTDKNPYKIWLLEVIMQQTRMSQGFPYFERISAAFPTVFDLANATEDSLFSLWKGLGYYSRARNLQFTAKFIVNELNGIFPNTDTELLKLKGVGEYTAAAIASFAFDEKVAVLDGNVHRVLSRVYGIDKTIQSSTDKKYFQLLANQLVFEKEPALFNQLMMDMGSDTCKPQNPICDTCPMTEICVAFKNDLTKVLPPPKKRIELKERHFYCLFINYKDKIYLEKRTESDIWKGLYQGILQAGEELDLDFWKVHKLDISAVDWSEWQTQLLSHQRIKMKLGVLKVNKTKLDLTNFFTIDELESIALPRIVSRWWENRAE